MFGFDGVEVGLLITLVCLFAGILSGYPVAFAIGGSALVAFAIIAGLSESGLLVKEIIDNRSDDYAALVGSGVKEHAITLFRYPELPTLTVPVFENGVDGAFFRILTFIVNRMNERVLAGPSIELLLAVAMFILMGISLERSRIAQDLLTSMARVFGALPGGLAVSVVVVGAFLAASTGIVGATVVTMGLLSLPTMLRNQYSPELATGVISASGTLGQIIPPSIVIVLLGTLAGDLYSTAQEERAITAGCRDALTYLGEAAVVSVGTLFKAAIVPGLLLAFIYAAYVFCYALVRPSKAPPVRVTSAGLTDEGATLNHRLFWFLAVPGLVIALAGGMVTAGLAGPQTVDRLALVERPESPELRTNVPDDCKDSMIELHGQEKWDRSLAMAEIGAAAEFVAPTDEELDALEAEAIDFLPPVSEKLLVGLVFLGLVMSISWGVAPSASRRPLLIGVGGIAATLAADAWLVTPVMSTGTAWLILALPIVAVLHGLRHALPRLAEVEILRVVFPPLVLIVAVLGSILGGVTSPTAAAGLGASGALMLSAYRRLSERKERRKGRIIIMSAWAVVVFLLVGINFDLRTSIEVVGFENWVAFIVSIVAYHVAFGGLIYSCVILYREGILRSVVRDTAKVTAMVFAILIGSQMLNLVVISYGGEEHIQEFLRSFDDEMVVFLVVMAVLFVLGFVLDFLEIIYIVIPIVGPVIYGGTLDPKWVTIMIAVNLQTSFLTPPFGFALFYLRGVAPPGITTGQIYRGVVPFVIIQIVALALMWFIPDITTFLPELLPEH